MYGYGTTDIASGCYRLHSVQWNIGESVGALIAYYHADRRDPHEVRANPEWLYDLQQVQRGQGVELARPGERYRNQRLVAIQARFRVDRKM